MFIINFFVSEFKQAEYKSFIMNMTRKLLKIAYIFDNIRNFCLKLIPKMFKIKICNCLGNIQYSSQFIMKIKQKMTQNYSMELIVSEKHDFCFNKFEKKSNKKQNT